MTPISTFKAPAKTVTVWDSIEDGAGNIQHFSYEVPVADAPAASPDDLLF